MVYVALGTAIGLSLKLKGIQRIVCIITAVVLAALLSPVRIELRIRLAPESQSSTPELPLSFRIARRLYE